MLEKHTRPCIICSKPFTNRQMKVRTCSRACGSKLSSVTQKDSEKRVCAVCKKGFLITRAWLRKPGNRGTYCSKECRWERTRMNYSKSDKVNAQRLVYNLMNRKILIPQTCEVCKSSQTEPHHYKGYKREHWLSIQWLCDKHHVQEHERLRRTGESMLL
jgi:hypothetical protein